jgi:hypothetical protein
MSIEITYRQATEEEARGIIYLCGGDPEKDYRPEDLPKFKYVDAESRMRLKQATSFVHPQV